MPSPFSVLIPAAGAARRMAGADKLTEPVAGVPILRRVAELALGQSSDVIVTLPVGGPFEHARRAALAGLPVRILGVADAAEGMSASLRAGGGAVRGTGGLMILLPDMPEIDAADLAVLASAFAAAPGQVVRGADAAGRPGHPVILPARLLAAIRTLRGDEGARALLAAETVELCPLPGAHALTDLDSPENWAAWRAGKGRTQP